MAIRKDGVNQNLEEKNLSSSEYNKVNDEESSDAGNISHNIEEGDEDYDDEALENEELTEDDFDIDEEDEDEKK